MFTWAFFTPVVVAVCLCALFSHLYFTAFILLTARPVQTCISILYLNLSQSSPGTHLYPKIPEGGRCKEPSV